jgi:hypothetical protein
MPVQRARRTAARQFEVIRAVRAYLQATRTPEAQTRADTAQIAAALSLPRRAVDRALVALKERGIKLTTR